MLECTDMKGGYSIMSAPNAVMKRDGTVVGFDAGKIASAISKACNSVGIFNPRAADAAEEISEKVIAILVDEYKEKTPGVEDIQNLVESTLGSSGYYEVLRSYILYRESRQNLRKDKELIGVTDELKLPINIVQVLKSRYLLKDEKGAIVESTADLYRRVAKVVANAEELYGGDQAVSFWEEEFYDLMTKGLFLPNSPTLMNAGTKISQLAACFVLPVGDSLKDIFRAISDMAVIQQSGGGTGFSFSRLRPRSDTVQSTLGVASGPISFMRIFDTATNVIKQGGKRRGANIGILNVDHPDIIDFITTKENGEDFTNFNFSVAVTDAFMEALARKEDYPLINPRTGRETGRFRAEYVFDKIVSTAWKTGEPGVVFIDEINRCNQTPNEGMVESTNPCGEQPLLPYESCFLGSVNLSAMVKEKRVDYEKLGSVVERAVRFLDDVIEVNRFPLPEIRAITLRNRKIGVGVMGFAEMLIRLGVPYDSKQALNIAQKVMAFISSRAIEASVKLGEERGSFPNLSQSTWPAKGYPILRNATLTTIAPTGTISILAGTSSGIEPLFAISFMRDILEGTTMLEVNEIFRELAMRERCYSHDLSYEIARKGSIQHLTHLPENLRRVFVTSHDISPQWHVRMQAAFQQFTDNAVSKTVNLPPTATTNDVRRIFRLAYKLKCKGITVYRDGSRTAQVLYKGSGIAEKEHLTVSSEYAGECAGGVCSF
jgi:ribonucleoside-diphosphate reductase alpha chain